MMRFPSKWHNWNIKSLSLVLIPLFLDGSFTRRDLLAREKDEPKNCTPPSIAEFANDLFNQHQRRLGAVIIHFLVAFYMSWGIAIVCDDYFVPCLELIADKMGIQSDVAGATFMAFGSSAPELFASVIGEFQNIPSNSRDITSISKLLHKSVTPLLL